MGVLQNLLLRSIAANGRAPASLEVAIGDGVPGMNVARDGWGRTWLYIPKGENYTLKSAGPDGRIHSRDDIVLTRNTDLRRL
jgi:hypothetical protein